MSEENLAWVTFSAEDLERKNEYSLEIYAFDLTQLTGNALEVLQSHRIVSSVLSLSLSPSENSDENENEFVEPVEIDLLVPSVYNVSSLALCILSEDYDEWICQDEEMRLKEGGNFVMIVKGTTPHFSTFAVINPAVDDSADDSDGEDGDGNVDGDEAARLLIPGGLQLLASLMG